MALDSAQTRTNGACQASAPNEVIQLSRSDSADCRGYFPKMKAQHRLFRRGDDRFEPLGKGIERHALVHLGASNRADGSGRNVPFDTKATAER